MPPRRARRPAGRRCRRHLGLPALLLGSVSSRVAAHATVPVVVVRGPLPGPAAPVVVGVDGWEHGEPTLAYAFDRAARRRVDLIAVTLVDPTQTGPSIGWALLPDLAARRDEQRAILAELMRPWAEKHPDVRVVQQVELGLAATTLEDAAADAAPLVVGSRGHGGFAGLLLGSVSQHALRHARCPVAVGR